MTVVFVATLELEPRMTLPPSAAKARSGPARAAATTAAPPPMEAARKRRLDDGDALERVSSSMLTPAPPCQSLSRFRPKRDASDHAEPTLHFRGNGGRRSCAGILSGMPGQRWLQ